MAEPLKNHFGIEIPGKIARMISAVFPEFPSNAFILDTLDGYETLELMQRGRKIARSLRRHLPEDYAIAVEILLASIGPTLDKTEKFGMAPFLYLPHVCFVAEYGLDCFEVSMRAQYELTQRFSAESSIRPFLVRYPDATLARLTTWAKDSSVHVRRLVSEGTRPRLPWAPRLRQFQKDPGPVLALLELLKDDPEIYVRRSVANNLNDIGKDHPALLVETTRKWMQDATPQRRWLIRHALRSAVKRAEPGALAVMGFDGNANVSVNNLSITPNRIAIGGSLKVAFDLANTDLRRQRVLVDFRIHFIKADGKARPKVFKLKTVDFAPQETVTMGKTVSLADMTTRKHYPGLHSLDVVVNGSVKATARFELARNQPST